MNVTTAILGSVVMDFVIFSRVREDMSKQVQLQEKKVGGIIDFVILIHGMYL